MGKVPCRLVARKTEDCAGELPGLDGEPSGCPDDDGRVPMVEFRRRRAIKCTSSCLGLTRRKRTFERSGFFDSCGTSICLQYSRGKVLSIPLFQTANLFPFLRNPHSCIFPLVFPCSKLGLIGIGFSRSDRSRGTEHCRIELRNLVGMRSYPIILHAQGHWREIQYKCQI